MSTVKIKTETAEPTAAAALDVKVKLEPSLSTADIKLEQHTSDIDTKVEPDSEDYIKSESDDEDDSDNDQNQFTITPKNQRQFICKYSGCGRSYNSAGNLGVHQHEHRLQTELTTHGKTYTLARQSLGDRWTCPIPDCTSTYKTVDSLCDHIRRYHNNTVEQHQQSPSHLTRNKLYFINVDDFYVNAVRCGYYTTIGVFICYECRLVPECLLTHFQQKHGYDEKAIDNSVLPESAVNANTDPNINQHTGNPHLAAAIGQPYQQHHQNIVQGWLCITSDCRYCSYTALNKTDHKRKVHQSEQMATVSALVLRLLYRKTQASCFLITRIDQASGAVTASGNRVNQYRLDYGHNGLNAQDENGDDVNQNETTEESNKKRQWVCEYEDCRRFFNSAAHLSEHRREHKMEVVINVRGTAFNLTRQSLDDRWACPVPDCETTWKTVDTTHNHIQYFHDTLLKHKRASMEDGDNSLQQPTIKKRQLNIRYLKVDDFYVSGTRCGYHTTTGLFICHECKLVPECLLTHLQQEHAYDERSIDIAFLPESARITGSDPNINQHTSNSDLAAAIRGPNQLQHPDVVQGWSCATTDCGFCYPTKTSMYQHQCREHKGEQKLIAPALVLRLLYGKTQSSYFLITRLHTTTISSTTPSNSVSQHNSECDYDDGDELVLSDYSDEDDIH